MYPFVLLLHSWNRWFVVLTLLLALGRAARGWLMARPFTRADNAVGGALIGFMHLQLVLGMILYGALSPLVRLAFADGGLHNPTLRFWAVEHAGLMVSAVLAAQIGRSASRRATSDQRRHQLAAGWYALALVLLLMGIPFVARPWFRNW